VRSPLLLFVLSLSGCATGVAVAPHTDPRSEAGGAPETPEKVVESHPAPERGEETANSDGVGEQAPPAATDLFAHCAYGPPNYGEDPGTDSQENFAVFVLERPLAQVCPSEPGAECASQVVMLHVSTLLESAITHAEALVGRHVRLAVSEYQAAETGHHHSRMVLWYDGVEDLGIARRKSLRATWATAKADFLGRSCKGFPR
jgi:hypothetical protein